jgi:hypothetical protein
MANQTAKALKTPREQNLSFLALALFGALAVHSASDAFGT